MSLSLALVLSGFAVVAFLLLLSLWVLLTTRVPVHSASRDAVETALDLLSLAPGDTFCDLGCGGGQVVRAARARADVRALGYELNPFAFLVAAARSLTDRRVRVRWADFRSRDLSEIDAAYAYLMPWAMAALAGPLEQRLKPGARVVSVDFPIPGWAPEQTREVGPLRQPVFLYRIGAHRAVEATPAEPEGK